MNSFRSKFRWVMPGLFITDSQNYQQFGSHICRGRSAVSQPSQRSGQALIEFAIISFCFTLLFSGILMLGFLIFGASVLQQAADVGAMEFARWPAPSIPSETVDMSLFFYQQLEDSGLFREAKLIVTQDEYDNPGALPLINRLLLPLYVYDPDMFREHPEWGKYRYPGALVMHGETPTVLIPIVGFGHRDPSTGVETISEWRRVVEEVTSAGSVGPYSVRVSNGNVDFQSGMVALRINYPYQSAAMVAYQHQYQTPEPTPDENGDEEGEIIPPADAIGQERTINIPIKADDDHVSGGDSAKFPDGKTLSEADYQLFALAPSPDYESYSHRGKYGMGNAFAWNMQVRPYRKVISAQGIYRREIFTAE